ncbi:MAG: hypothetical protein Q8Q46_03265, partial [Candidatus Giovannonibacteria bacterium]|nr:hypothetical protein [Candidatus Giovannonibacteria bacterium]
MRFYFLGFILAALVVSVFLHFGADKISDPDIFYHFAHADIYKNSGISQSAFPWLPYSAIEKYSADIWYGFHILLIPFTFLKDHILGMRLAGVFITFVFLVLFYFSCAVLKITPKFFWPFFVIFSSPFFLYHTATARPHVLSLGLNILFFAFLASENIWGVFFAGIASAFLHLSLFWASILIFGVWVLVKILNERKIPAKEGLVLAAGILAGWILRPNPLGAAKLAYIQTAGLAIEKLKSVPLHFGSELLPLGSLVFSYFWLFFVVWIIAAFLFFWAQSKRANLTKQQKTAIWASLILSFIFFLMTAFLAQRSFDFWVGFGVIFIGLVYACRLYAKNFIIYLGIFILIFSAGYSIYQRNLILNSIGWETGRFQTAGEWLKNNSRAGDIVFNTSWDYFPEIFFWDSKNFYISGMDPIFQYAFSQKLYWEAYYLETGKTAGFTCPATSCDEKT